MTEEELLEKIRSDKKKPKNYGRMRVVFPIGEEPPEELANQQKSQKRKNKKQPNARPPKSEPPQAPVTRQPDPGIIELANNDDLNVETIARQAKKNQTKVKSDKGEVVISLHEDE